MFGTVLNYVTLRLLGEGANDGQGAMERGRNWILNHGGATTITSWGKMWLSVSYSPLAFLFLYHEFGFSSSVGYSVLTLVVFHDENRYLEHLNGLAIIPCPLKYGFFLICSLFTQVVTLYIYVYIPLKHLVKMIVAPFLLSLNAFITLQKGENVYIYDYIMVQEGCGATAAWSICLCLTCMERGLLVQLLPQFYLFERSSTLSHIMK